MALYDGFFDAYEDEETGEYDRVYDSEEFVQYFGQIIGSGVCVYENPDSFKVQLSGGNAVVSPGYLFIRGYWLKNDADYTVQLTGSGVQAVVAHLNLTKKMIEIEAQSKAQSYPDSLVLAYVDTAAGTVQDTRPDTDICGIIDAAGSVSNKIIWATDYINNEVKAKLAQAEADINAQSVELDKRIEQVSKAIEQIVSPPIGTIKFSAAQTPESGWLRCDGSYITKAEYPELVSALNQITPGIEDFNELLNAETSSHISNVCIANGTAWVYLVESHKLVGFSTDGKKEISVSGVSALVSLSNIDTVLSICGGSLYLAQSQQSGTAIVLLECVSFTGSETQISMSQLNISDHTSGLDVSRCVPSVIDAGGTKYMALGEYERYEAEYLGGKKTRKQILKTIHWTAGNFASASEDEYWTALLSARYTTEITYQQATKRLISCYYAFSVKNSSEMLLPSGCVEKSNGLIVIGYNFASVTQKIYGEFKDGKAAPQVLQEVAYNNKYDEALIESPYDPPINVIPVAGGGEYLLRAEITAKKLKITVGGYGSAAIYDWRTLDIPLPETARLFKGSVVYGSARKLWLIFVGTGILFTSSLRSGVFGYLNTQEIMGTITENGNLSYDSTTNTVYISGVNLNGMPVVGEMELQDLNETISDGTWLPVMASGGIPAYIKAKEAQG